TLYLLTKLRQDVFSLEQRATEPDLDGRDLDPTTILLWIETPRPDADAAGMEREPVAHARVLTARGTVRIGRVAVRATERRPGYGRRLTRATPDPAAEPDPRAEVPLDAQAHLEPWSASTGFATVSDVSLAAGSEHVAIMFRQPTRAEISSR